VRVRVRVRVRMRHRGVEVTEVGGFEARGFGGRHVMPRAEF
jgi:hypothetical protein